VQLNEQSLWLRSAPEAITSSAANRPTVIIFPHAGGAATFYHPLATRLNRDVDVRIVQYPGRQDRRCEPIPTSIDAYVQEIYAGIAGALPEENVFFGHSMGGIIAYEVCALMHTKRDANAPSQLMISGRRPPQPTNAAMSDLPTMTERDMRKLGGVDTRLLADPDFLAEILRVVNADYHALHRYSPSGTCLPIPISVFAGDSDPNIEIGALKGWAALTAMGMVIRTFAGGHFYMLEHPADTAAEIVACAQRPLIPLR
jgi:surfactin synthase thioesterase subunit